QHPAPEAIVEVQEVGVSAGTELSRKLAQTAFWFGREDPGDMWIVAEQGGMGWFGEYGDTRPRVALPDGTEQWSGQKDIADRAETHGQDIRCGGRVVHGGKVLR
ncbi:MAG TPA: hypothetical protein VFX42_05100, partial [Gemmatimonadales bacterium]|nr:hypothetical protein [Gemmatimonadales bacterium]